MQVTKPQALGLSTRPVEYRKRFGLCITASLHVPFAQGERGSLWSEQSMWDFLSQEMAVPQIDEGVAKLSSEFLVHGRAFPPPGQPTACAVRASLGSREKTLLVFGERRWDGAQATAPQPFEQMPIDWAHAYGGADFAANLAGRGRAVEGAAQWLPNIESPGERLLRPDHAVAPAGFGMLEPMHPQRAQYRGTYDASYLREHAPGFPPDLDWRHFNLAPPDQWFDLPLHGDEPFAFDHMHPARQRIEGRLPGLCARVFAGYRIAGTDEPKLREVPLRLTTAWFFPHAERAILLFQGMAEVGTDDGSDVVTLAGAVERLGERRSDAHYADAMARRADPRMGGVHMLHDGDLLPEGLDTFDPAVEAAREAFAMDGLQGEAQYLRAEADVALAREEVRAQGKDPDALGIRMPTREKVPTGAELAPYLERQMKEVERQQWSVLEDAVTQAEKALAFAAEQKIPLEALEHRGPPRFSAEGRFDAMRTAFSAQGKALDTAAVYPALIRQEAAERLAYRQSAHAQAPAAAMPPDEAKALRGEIARAIGGGLRRFEDMDLTGADLSGLDLRGANFSGAWLESANLSKSNLSGADFSRAVLAHADLRGAVGVGTRFAEANLGGAQLAGVALDEADLCGAVLSRCSFAGTQLRRARLDGAQLLDTQWGAADWSHVQAPRQLFYKLDLKGLVLTESELDDCNFIECDLSGCDLRGARLQRASFVGCKLAGAHMAGVLAEGAVFVQGSSLAGADLSGARLARCNFGETDMEGARLVQARLDGANLTAAKLGRCDLRLASATGAVLRKAVLRQAVMAGTNLSNAVMQHADLRGADLRRSNLFGADLSRVRLDGDVRFEDALLTRARTWPRLTPEQQAAP